MSALLAVAGNTVRGAVRDRVLYLVVFFAVLVILGSEALAVLTIGDPDKVVQDIGLAAIAFFGALLAAFLGLSTVSREIDRRTVYTVVSKPIARGQFLAGKFLGLYAVVVMTVVAMSAIFLAFAWLRHGVLSRGLVAAAALSLVEDLLLAAFAILFSSFTSPILGALFTLTLYVVGHLSYGLQMLVELPALRGSAAVPFFRVLYYLLPNLERFNVRGAAVYGDPIGAALLLPAAAYGVVYALAVLTLAAAVFTRRDFV